MNAFELLGFEPALNIDEALLHERFERLRAQFHPDRFSLGSSLERRLAVQRAADINDAHAVLADPIARARLLLELRGEGTDECETVQDSDFLIRQMELREALDAAFDAPARERLRTEAERQWGEEWTALDMALSNGASQDALRRLQRLQFLRRLLEQLPAPARTGH
ncbi:MAG: Fe-S protein assembly co-chaperone HscB [Pseudomonadota bacterium]